MSYELLQKYPELFRQFEARADYLRSTKCASCAGDLAALVSEYVEKAQRRWSQEQKVSQGPRPGV